MSCQQVSRIISTTTATTTRSLPIVITASVTKALSTAATNAVTATATATTAAVVSVAEDQDPYAFTESVPTPLPILFNGQKSRSRHIDAAAVLINTVDATTTTSTNTINTSIKATQNHINQQSINLNDKHVVTASIPTTTTTTTQTASPTAVINCKTVQWIGNNVIQRRKQNQRQINRANTTTIENNCITLSSPPLSPPLASTATTTTASILTSSSTTATTKVTDTDLQPTNTIMPTACLQLTPSLWQTPLILDTNCVNKISEANSPLHSPISELPSPPAIMTNIANSNLQLLPPSNFHHTTLAQHLHKVECIKKPKKTQIQTTPQAPFIDVTQKVVITTPPATPPKSTAVLSPVRVLPQLHAIELQQQKQQQQQQQQHSDSDLNEIPVNVIFRKPQTTTATTTAAAATSTSTMNVQDTNTTTPTINTTIASTSISSSTTNSTTITPISISKTISSLVPTPSSPSTATTTNAIIRIVSSNNITKPIVTNTYTENSPPALAAYRLIQCQLKKPATTTTATIVTPTTTATSLNVTSTKLNANIPITSATEIMLKHQMSSNTLQNQQHQESQIQIQIQKQNQEQYIEKLSTNEILPATNSTTSVKQLKSSQLNNKKMDSNMVKTKNLRTGPVAVVKMSVKECNADIALLAKSTVLPYCIQKHWYNSENLTSNAESCIRYVKGREERIAHSKNLLQRQALQMLNTKSLQRLPFHYARKRLLCIDNLLRKYVDHNIVDIDVK